MCPQPEAWDLDSMMFRSRNKTLWKRRKLGHGRTEWNSVHSALTLRQAHPRLPSFEPLSQLLSFGGMLPDVLPELRQDFRAQGVIPHIMPQWCVYTPAMLQPLDLLIKQSEEADVAHVLCSAENHLLPEHVARQT